MTTAATVGAQLRRPAARRTVALAAASVLLAFGVIGCSGSSQSVCAAPEITATPTAAAAGSTIKIKGFGFSSTCDDQGKGEAPQPLTDQDVVLNVDGVETVLGTVDSEDGSIATSVQLPDEVRPGPAQLRVGFSVPLEITIT
jgi:hypothetical protein